MTHLIQLFNGSLQPPVRSHERQGDCDLGVHRAEGPVLPEEEDWGLRQRHPNRHEYNDFKEDSEEEWDHTDKEDNGNACLRTL